MQSFGRILDAVFVFGEIDASVLRAYDEIRLSVLVEVANGRATGVARDVAFGEIANLFEDHFSIARIFAVAPPGGVLGVGEDVVAAITVPVDDSEFDATGTSGGLWIQANGFEVFVEEDAFAVACEVALVIENYEVEVLVAVKVVREWCGAPLGRNFTIKWRVLETV